MGCIWDAPSHEPDPLHTSRLVAVHRKLAQKWTVFRDDKAASKYCTPDLAMGARPS